MALTALKVRGPFKGPSGYDHHVREFVRELHRQGVAVELIDLPEWGPARLPTHRRDPWFDSLDQPTGADVVLHFCMPHQVRPEPRRINVNYTMFEASRIPPAWVEHSRRHDLIVLPTGSSKRAWIAGGVPEERLRLCPLGINPELFAPPITLAPMPLRGTGGQPIAAYRTRFLNVSELGPRKNLVGLLRAWLRATSSRDDAVLIVKLGCYAPGWPELFRQQLGTLERQLGQRLDEAAPVHFVYDLFSDAEMPRLYAAATHYISLSYGEGWDQAMVEAAASGLRLIAPDHSAYTTYLDPSMADLIPCRQVPARFVGDPTLQALFAGATWWEPDEEAAAGFLRAAIEGRDGSKVSARERVLHDFTWERATRRLLSLLAEAEARKNRARSWPRRLWRRWA